MAIKNDYSIIRILQKDIWNGTNNWKTQFNDTYKYYKKPNVICIGCDIKYKKYTEIDEDNQKYNCDQCSGSFYFESNLEAHNCDDYVKLIRKINFAKKLVIN